jgi:hypothetical protein
VKSGASDPASTAMNASTERAIVRTVTRNDNATGSSHV